MFVKRHHKHSTNHGALRITAAVVAIAATVGALTACSSTTPSTGKSTAVNTHALQGKSTITIETSTDNNGATNLKKLVSAFTKQYPKIKVVVESDTFANLQVNAPRIMASSSAPDLMYLPTLGNTVKDKLLTNLDPYAAAYGWDKFPATQLSQMRVKADGLSRGAGTLYGMGMGFTVTGIYYNKSLAKAAGISSVPKNLAEFESDLQKAKDGGQLPLVTSAKDTNIFFVYQSLIQAQDPSQTEKVTNWTFDAPHATINTPASLKAASTLQQWVKDGYISSDVNALDASTTTPSFQSGQGVFYSSGNWIASALASMGSNVGFFPFPSTTTNKPVGLSDPVEYVIPAKAKNPNGAAAFMNWINTNPIARGLTNSVDGLVPGGAGGKVSVPSPVAADTLTAFDQIGKADGLAPFIGNATASIYASTLTPQLQLLAGQKVTPESFVEKLQSDYESQLSAQ